jgi:hypothetical protein
MVWIAGLVLSGVISAYYLGGNRIGNDANCLIDVSSQSNVEFIVSVLQTGSGSSRISGENSPVVPCPTALIDDVQANGPARVHVYSISLADVSRTYEACRPEGVDPLYLEAQYYVGPMVGLLITHPECESMLPLSLVKLRSTTVNGGFRIRTQYLRWREDGPDPLAESHKGSVTIAARDRHYICLEFSDSENPRGEIASSEVVDAAIECLSSATEM